MERNSNQQPQNPNQTHSRRVLRAEREIREIIAVRLLAGIGFEFDGMLSITRVQVTSDLRTARVFASALTFGQDAKSKAVEKAKDEVASHLNKMAGEFQRELARKLPMRYCPKLTFQLDESLEKQLKVERLLHDIRHETRGDSGPSSNQ